MQKLKTNHYKSKFIYTKKLKFNNKIYFGFNINNLQDLKFEDKLKVNDVVEFNLKGLSFINSEYLSKSLYI